MLQTNQRTKAQRPGLLLSLLNSTVDLVFPPCCAGCARVDWAWCPHCDDDLRKLPITPIKRRGKYVNGLLASGVHTGQLQQAVQALKYDGITSLAAPLAARLTTLLRRTNVTIDIIIPVPMHKTRTTQRGYNQAKLIARHVSEQAEIPMEEAIYRTRQTRSQVGLNRGERRVNVAEAFQTQTVLRGQRLLIVDDVLTTGATLDACAQVARQAGAKTIYGLTVTAATLSSHRR